MKAPSGRRIAVIGVSAVTVLGVSAAAGATTNVQHSQGGNGSKQKQLEKYKTHRVVDSKSAKK
jgi:hypothetical protein